MATKEKSELNLDPITSPIEETVETVVPFEPKMPSESTDAEERHRRYNRIRQYVSFQFAKHWDMNATMGRLGFGWKEDR